MIADVLWPSLYTTIMGAWFSHSGDVEKVPSGSLDFAARNGKVYCNGVQFSFKGINWFGSEAYNGPPNGLDAHDIGWYLDFMQRHKFNAVRLLFNHEHVLKNDIVNTPRQERLLFQVRYLQMFQVLAKEAAKRGIIVLLACHRVKHDAWPGSGLWYDDKLGMSEARVRESWDAVAKALCGQWNVFAVVRALGRLRLRIDSK